MFPSSTPPDSDDQLVIKLCSGLIRSHSSESGGVEEGNMQGSGTPRTGIENLCYRPVFPNPGPQGTTACMLHVFLLQHT